MPQDQDFHTAVLEALYRHTTNAVIVVDKDRHVQFVNPGFTKMFGYEPGEVIGHTTEGLYRDSAQFEEIAAELTRLSGQPPDDIYYAIYRSKSGQEIIGETKAAVFADNQGGYAGFIGIIRDITETVNRTGLAEETEQLFRDALESVHDTAWRMDLVTNEIELAGPAAHNIFGIKEKKGRLSLNEWKQRLTEAGVTACNQFVQDLLDSGQAQTFLTFERPDGTLIFAKDTGRVIRRAPDGTPLVAAGTFADITERKALEERTTETEQYLDSALEAADLAAWRFDLVENTCRLSGPLARLVNLETENEEFTGAYWCSLLHRADVGEVIRQTAAMAEGRSNSVDVLYRLRDKAGQWRWIRSIGGVTRQSEDGLGLVANGIIKDETETVALRKNLEAERNRFETIFRNTPAMLHQIDENGIVRDVSAYWLSHMGYVRDEVVGKPFSTFLTDESRIYAENFALPDFMKNGQARNVALEFKKKNGEVIDGLMNAYLETRSGTGERVGYGVITDVTQLRRAYRDLERSNRELDRFATIASHDLQEPLRKVTAFAGILASRHAGQLDSDGVQYLDLLSDAAARMQKLIDDVLEYSQLEIRPMKPERLSLVALITDIKARLSTSITQSGTTITISGSDTIHADRFLLNQILQNLISNSIKYHSEQAPDIRIRMVDEPGGWTVTLSDNGIGFDPKFTNQVFEPFRRLHPRGEYEGAGIGLAIVRQAVDRQNGRISVDTRPQKGTTFTIFLPRHSAQQSVA
ncbi:PAS domain S-box protein [Hyphobacterium sp.]|uniref:PAS domain-containing sensor histidine kinase n=1 Tax=Hyphobacterium sp. TaxID=2004662 RepID=UPI003747C72B